MSQHPDESSGSFDGRKVTTNRLSEMKSAGVPIAALTAYDYTMAQLVDAAGVDVILVGDSVSTVMQGLETTVTVTMEHMLYHTTLVRRGVERALVVADLPFMSYQVRADEALRNAGRMVKEAGAEAVKLEESIVGYLLDLVAATREHEALALGASTRGAATRSRR